MDSAARQISPGSTVNSNVVASRLKWSGTLALVFLGAIVVVALYGRYANRSRLGQIYAERLQEISREVNTDVLHTPEELIPLGLELEICWDRLVRTGQALPWRIVYLQAISGLLEQLSLAPVSSDNDVEKLREDLTRRLGQQEIEYLREVSTHLLADTDLDFALWLGRHVLQAPPSVVGPPHREAALKLLSHWHHRSLEASQESSFFSEAAKNATERPSSERATFSGNQRFAEDQQERLLSNREISEIRLLLAKNLVEKAWDTPFATPNEPVNRPLLEQAREVMRHVKENSIRSVSLQLEILSHLAPQQAIERIEALQGGTLPLRTFEPASPMTTEATGHAVWEHVDLSPLVAGDLRALQVNLRDVLACHQCSRFGPARRRYIAREWGRIFLSPLAAGNPDGYSQAPGAVHLALQCDPHAPELVLFLWQAVLSHADQDSLLPSLLVESLILDQETTTRFVILAASSLMRDEIDQALAYAELGEKRHQDCIPVLAAMASRVIQLAPDAVVNWKVFFQRLTELRPDDGFAWLTAGLLAIQVGDRATAEEAIQRAGAILGEIPAVLQLRQHLQRNANP